MTLRRCDSLPTRLRDNPLPAYTNEFRKKHLNQKIAQSNTEPDFSSIPAKEEVISTWKSLHTEVKKISNGCPTKHEISNHRATNKEVNTHNFARRSTTGLNNSRKKICYNVEVKRRENAQGSTLPEEDKPRYEPGKNNVSVERRRTLLQRLLSWRTPECDCERVCKPKPNPVSRAEEVLCTCGSATARLNTTQQDNSLLYAERGRSKSVGYEATREMPPFGRIDPLTGQVRRCASAGATVGVVNAAALRARAALTLARRYYPEGGWGWTVTVVGTLVQIINHGLQMGGGSGAIACTAAVRYRVSPLYTHDRSWSQASLPIRFGGLGVRSSSSVALPAFLSSAHSAASLFGNITNPSMGSIELPYLTEALNEWAAKCPDICLPLRPKSQKDWDEPLCKLSFNNIISSSTSSADKARLIAVSAKESGHWLHAFPSANTGTLLDRNSLTMAVGLRLGCPLIHPHMCQCGDPVDQFGYHGLSCARSAGRFQRHTAINDIIRRSLTSANVPNILEPNGIFRSDGKRPDGMTLGPWKLGKSLVWDATCVDTMAPSHLGSTCLSAGAAANTAEKLKRRKYSNLTSCYLFAPLAFETFGPWGDDTRVVLKEIASRLIETSGDNKAGSYLHIPAYKSCRPAR